MMQPPTAIRTGMALAEFIREHEAAPFELIGTERIPRMPTTSGHNDLMDRLYTLLKEHVQQAGTVRMEATFVLPEAYDAAWVTGARTPDVLYYAAERLNAYKAAHPDWPRTPYLLVPDLVVEIMSPTDVGAKIDARIEAYLADGVRLIWLVKPHNRTVVIYTPDDDQPRVLRPPAALAGGAVLPGFTLPLSDLFA